MEESEPFTEKGTRSELKMIETALSDPLWVIPDAAKAYLPKRMLEICAKSTHERNVIAATRVLSLMAKQNQPPEASLHLHQHAKVSASAEQPQPEAMTLEQIKQRNATELGGLKRLSRVG